MDQRVIHPVAQHEQQKFYCPPKGNEINTRKVWRLKSKKGFQHGNVLLFNG